LKQMTIAKIAIGNLAKQLIFINYIFMKKNELNYYIQIM
jgi:hypothetical protein